MNPIVAISKGILACPYSEPASGGEERGSDLTMSITLSLDASMHTQASFRLDIKGPEASHSREEGRMVSE